MIKETNKYNEEILAMLHLELILESLKEYSFDRDELKKIIKKMETKVSKR